MMDFLLAAMLLFQISRLPFEFQVPVAEKIPLVG